MTGMTGWPGLIHFMVSDLSSSCSWRLMERGLGSSPQAGWVVVGPSWSQIPLLSCSCCSCQLLKMRKRGKFQHQNCHISKNQVRKNPASRQIFVTISERPDHRVILSGVSLAITFALLGRGRGALHRSFLGGLALGRGLLMGVLRVLAAGVHTEDLSKGLICRQLLLLGSLGTFVLCKSEAKLENVPETQTRPKPGRNPAAYENTQAGLGSVQNNHKGEKLFLKPMQP